MNDNLQDSKNDKLDEYQLNEIKFQNQRLWDYFKYHANQRMLIFRFFVVMTGLAFTACGYLFYISHDHNNDCIIDRKLLWVKNLGVPGLTKQEAVTRFVRPGTLSSKFLKLLSSVVSILETTVKDVKLILFLLI